MAYSFVNINVQVEYSLMELKCEQWEVSGEESWSAGLLRMRREFPLGRGVGNERNLVHLVEKSVEIKLKSWEIKAYFLEIKLGNQPNPPAPPTFTTYDVIFGGNRITGKSNRNQEISYAKIAPTPRLRPRAPKHSIVRVCLVHTANDYELYSSFGSAKWGCHQTKGQAPVGLGRTTLCSLLPKWRRSSSRWWTKVWRKGRRAPPGECLTGRQEKQDRRLQVSQGN